MSQLSKASKAKNYTEEIISKKESFAQVKTNSGSRDGNEQKKEAKSNSTTSKTSAGQAPPTSKSKLSTGRKLKLTQLSAGKPQ